MTVGLLTTKYQPSIPEGQSNRTNRKSLERTESVTGEVVLCLGLVDDGRAGLSQEIHETSFYSYLLAPHIMGILS